jgi:Ca2+-binding RTX toxin-like protein
LLLAKPGDDGVPGVTVKSIASATDAIGSNFADRIIGDQRANTIYAKGGNDRVFGGVGNDKISGGAGKDTLSGGRGADDYMYFSKSHGGDTITYFSSIDQFHFDNAAFGLGVATGALDTFRFRSRTDNIAQDTNDRFIYRTTDDTLWFDIDGSGSKAAVLIANVQNNTTVTAGDILLF